MKTETMPLAQPAATKATKNLERVQIGYAAVHSIARSEAIDFLLEYALSSAMPGFVVTPNAQHIVLLDSDPHFREIYSQATLVLPDGASLMLAGQILGRRLQERVTGVDLFQSLCGRAAQAGLRVFLLGGRPGSAARAARNLTKAHPGLMIRTYCPAFGFERNQRELREVADVIRDFAPHMLFAGLGAPKQEYWIYEHGRNLGVPICVGVGGAFEMAGGLVRRAPAWVQRAGMEWSFRLLTEPRRLWKRYLIGNAQFMAIIAKQLLSPVAYSAEAKQWQ